MTRNQKKHVLIQVLRHCCQLIVLAIMVGTVYLSLYAHYRAARAIEDEQFTRGFQGAVLKSIDRVVSSMEQPQEVLDSFKGTLWSMRFAGVDLTDPLAAAEVIAGSKTFYLPLLISIMLPVVLTLVMGRVYCSWMCPAGLLFELSDKVRRLLHFAEIKPGQMKFSHGNKYVFLVVGLAFTAVIGLPVLGHIYPPAVMSRLAHGLIYGTAITGTITILAVMVAFEIVVSPRWWCRTMCPGGALFGLLGWIRPVRIRLDARRCTGCRDCEASCPMGLDPVKQSYSIECDNCALCLKSCGDDALIFAIGLPGRRRAYIKQPSRAKTAPLRRVGETLRRLRREVTSITSLIVLLAANATVYAHHILGLPHYSYKENYPQVPTLEYPASAGPYDIVMTSYPGVPTPGEAANVAFYIRNRDSEAPFSNAVNVRVLQTATFGRSKTVLETTRIEPMDNMHKMAVTFPQDGEFIVELTMDVEGQVEVIPFLMVAGHPTATASVLAGIGGGLALFIIVVRAVKIKAKRRQSVSACGNGRRGLNATSLG